MAVDTGKTTGLSKLARLVDVYAKRPQVQVIVGGQCGHPPLMRWVGYHKHFRIVGDARQPRARQTFGDRAARDRQAPNRDMCHLWCERHVEQTAFEHQLLNHS